MTASNKAEGDLPKAALATSCSAPCIPVILQVLQCLSTLVETTAGDEEVHDAEEPSLNSGQTGELHAPFCDDVSRSSSVRVEPRVEKSMEQTDAHYSFPHNSGEPEWRRFLDLESFKQTDNSEANEEQMRGQESSTVQWNDSTKSCNLKIGKNKCLNEVKFEIIPGFEDFRAGFCTVCKKRSFECSICGSAIGVENERLSRCAEHRETKRHRKLVEANFKMGSYQT
eukprot:CAMPEP_0196734202 /NCGR_PEP_ID=MMETSP1091-20130531/13006_1 /TAXON_ID=302021 /ORGANISM="Rhodomonas sp., Strain CCMP768" /LENGTH=225 /DNA_ID=CAMNT_0042077675 /DNA_START=59 /DNA_END=736 /DNA_ORIENTATION=+